MRVAMVAESFPAQANGVSNAARHTVDCLLDTGHEVLVVAAGPGPAHYRSAAVVRVRSIGLPGRRSVPLGIPDNAIERSLRRFRADLVHLASPVALGAVGLQVARRLGVPTVAVYQTDIADFARRYSKGAELMTGRWIARIHRRATRTLVPSTASQTHFEALGVPNVHVWRPGVPLELFGPANRCERLRANWVGRQPDDVVVGYVGRLAPDKHVRRLTEIVSVPGMKLLVIGDGPSRGLLQRRIPSATFTGRLEGRELARAFASLDVLVDTGENEYFCQAVQEAQVSGVPVVAPSVGAAPDLVESGITGLLYDPADKRSLRRTVATLVTDAQLRRRLANEARQQASARAWPSRVADLLALHYPAVIEPGPADAAV